MKLTRQTTFPKGNVAKRKWYIVDVKDCVLGRVASRIAAVLIGKEKNDLYTTYANNASGVIVINAAHIKVTGDKLEERFFWHTGFAGGIKSRTMKERLNSKDPGQVIFKAVERMVPRNALGRAKMKNLRVFAEAEHVHQGLNPIVWDLASEHSMNKIKED